MVTKIKTKLYFIPFVILISALADHYYSDYISSMAWCLFATALIIILIVDIGISYDYPRR